MNSKYAYELYFKFEKKSTDKIDQCMCREIFFLFEVQGIYISAF